MIFKKAQEILTFFEQNIQYGILDISGKIHRVTDENFWMDFGKYFILKSPKALLKTKIGVCFDQVELSRYLFNNQNIKIKSYFICYLESMYSHSILTFEENGNFYWLETSHRAFIGIHKYDSMLNLLKDFKNKFAHNPFSKIPENYNKSKLKIFEYTKPNYFINFNQYFEHIKK